MRQLLLLITGLLFATFAQAQVIPSDAQRYRADLTRAAHAMWGLNAPVATFAAQIHQESGWREAAASPVGARGLAQFMPATAVWINGAYPALRDYDTDQDRSSRLGVPMNPAWALRALVTYDKHLYNRAAGATPCDRMWFALWGYNGGEGWRKRDQALAARHGADIRYAAQVEPFNAGRSAANFRENRGYPRRILLTLEPRYEAAGWGRGMCA